MNRGDSRQAGDGNPPRLQTDETAEQADEGGCAKAAISSRACVDTKIGLSRFACGFTFAALWLGRLQGLMGRKLFHVAIFQRLRANGKVCGTHREQGSCLPVPASLALTLLKNLKAPTTLCSQTIGRYITRFSTE